VATLALRDAVHRYGGRVVLDVPAFELSDGITALVGPNGSGKSTLLRLLAALEEPSDGVLEFEGRPIRTRVARRAARRAITLVEQHPLLFDMTVAANLADALRLHGDRGPEPRRRIAEALDRVGAGALASRSARLLSGGETQRVAIARALLLVPRVLLLDEPLSAADRAARDALGDVLTALRERGTVVCLSSHVLEEAYRWSSRIFTLVDGRPESLTPENLFRVEVPPGSGPRSVTVGPLSLLVVTDRSGPAILAIPPEDILVSRAPLESSARNRFPGRVSAIADDGRGGIRLAVDVGVELVARITPRSLAELELHVGTPVVLSVKAVAVRVF
jgi:tungstate transport system ATP-binding protein